VAAVALTAVGQIFFIPACLLWSLLIIAADAVALSGLCAHGHRENADATWHRSPPDACELNGAGSPRGAATIAVPVGSTMPAGYGGRYSSLARTKAPAFRSAGHMR